MRYVDRRSPRRVILVKARRLCKSNVQVKKYLSAGVLEEAGVFLEEAGVDTVKICVAALGGFTVRVQVHPNEAHRRMPRRQSHRGGSFIGEHAPEAADAAVALDV